MLRIDLTARKDDALYESNLHVSRVSLLGRFDVRF